VAPVVAAASVAVEMAKDPHTVLAVASMLPVVGTAAAAIDVGLYLAEGDMGGAAMASLAFVPGGAIAKLGGKALNSFEKGAKIVSAVEKVGSKVASGVDNAASMFGKVTGAVSSGIGKLGSKFDDILGGIKNRFKSFMERGADDAATSLPSKVEIAAGRRSAVDRAWRQERNLVRETGSGTRKWTDDEVKELLTRGRVKGYQGHHINSVDWSIKNTRDPLSWIRNPNNITFLKRAAHQAAHGGDFGNWTTGTLLDRRIL
jgi:hypothetical protein